MQEVRTYLNYLNDLNSQEQPIVPDNLIRNILHFLIIYVDASSTSSIDTSNKYKTITGKNARRSPTHDQIAHKLVEISSVEH